MGSERSTQNRGLSRRDVLRRGAVATALAGLGLSGVAGSAAAGGDGGGGVPSDAIPIDGPTEITEPGYYVLTKDIVVNNPMTVIVVKEGVPDVTIDGHGHTIKGPGKNVYQSTGIRAGLYLSDDTLNCTVKNLIVTGFETGIEYSDNRNGTISHVKITHCEAALRLYSVTDLTIADNVIAKNDIVFFQDEGARRTRVLRNRITRNEGIAGFEFAPDLLFKDNRFDYNGSRLGLFFCQDATVVDNLFYQNGGGLFIFETLGNVVRKNRFIENERYGVAVDGISTEIVIEENDILRNGGDGINFEFRVDRSTISKNRIIGNGEDGVFLLDADENQIVGNLIRQNGGDGIELQGREVSGVESGGSDNNVIRENVIRENGDLPIRIDDLSTGNVVEDNQIGDDAPNVCRLPEE
ncbi:MULTISPECIES: nitrous oxide reductase family maturation protein NosD [Haloferax]|nr:MULTISPECIES: right-handed parallel beta-helix repeat-containing protein [Haloferax]